MTERRPPDSVTLADATYAELMAEVKARAIACIVVAERDSVKVPGNVNTFTDYQGSYAHVLGLMEHARIRIHHAMADMDDAPEDDLPFD